MCELCKRNDGGGGSDGGATEEAEEEEEEEEEPGVSDQKQKPHTKMWGKNMYILCMYILYTYLRYSSRSNKSVDPLSRSCICFF